MTKSTIACLMFVVSAGMAWAESSKAFMWPANPLVTLEEEGTAGSVTWAQVPPTGSAAFDGAVHNVLRVAVSMRFKRPYAASAPFYSKVEVLRDSGWELVGEHYDTFSYLPEHKDRWVTTSRQYDVFCTNDTDKELRVRFRVTVGTHQGGYAPGSAGKLVNDGPREFNAVFSAPTRSMRMEYRQRVLPPGPRPSN